MFGVVCPAKLSLRNPRVLTFVNRPHSELDHQPVVKWQECHSGWVPHGLAVVGGHDVGGEQIFVGRAHCDGDVVPGKIVPSHHTCYVPFGGKEHARREYQVLTSTSGSQMLWVKASNGEIPTGAIQGGRTSGGEALFVGRAHHKGSHCVGKIHPSHHCLYMPFGGNEIKENNYEVLCVRSINF